MISIIINYPPLCIDNCIPKNRFSLEEYMNQPFYGVASIPSALRPDPFPDNHNPAPNTYDRNKERHAVELPQWTLKPSLQHGRCFQQLSNTPGPADYESPSQFNKKPGNNSLSKYERYPQDAQKSSISDHVNLPGSMNLKGGFSFGYREVFKDLERSPGPIYHLDQPIEQQRRNKLKNSYSGFGFGNRDWIYKRDDPSPGPAAFEIQKIGNELNKNRTCANWTFGNSKRNLEVVKDDIGPGKYSPRMPELNRSFKLRGKNQPKEVPDNNTGPASYSIPDTKTKLGARFSSPTNQGLNQSKKPSPDSNPISPFSYSPPRYLDKVQSRGYSIGHKSVLVLSDNNKKPGPGDYDISPNSNAYNGGYMGRKLNQKTKQSVMDNFHKYDPKPAAVARQAPKFSFPQGRKSIGKENEPLNRNSHEFTMEISPKHSGHKYSMGNSKRFTDFVLTGPLQSTEIPPTIGVLPKYLKRRTINKNDC